MRQKEVMGQSIRTSKSARPGTITYVPIDKSEFRSTVSSDKKKNIKAWFGWAMNGLRFLF